MTIQHIAAFSKNQLGGNPAGVYIGDHLPSTDQMQRTAFQIGYSESVFAAPQDGQWRTRYFSPETEVPFCGHATIALGAALAMKTRDGIFSLKLNQTDITVSGKRQGSDYFASLQSPATKSTFLEADILLETLRLFRLQETDLNPRFQPAIADAGATHIILVLKERERLAEMGYDLNEGREFMLRQGLVTIALMYAEDNNLFHARNAFASGGVLEDPATGAAAAAFAGYLRDVSWPHNGSIRIIQGEDMGMKSEIIADIPDEKGSSIKISGAAHVMSI